MKISYAIPVCNELDEIKRLVPLILEHKRPEDEIVILYDANNGNEEVHDFLLRYNDPSNIKFWKSFEFNNHFANWKNLLNSYCSGDYIIQLDADEMVSEFFIKNIPEIINVNPHIDLFFISRINTVSGLTQEHIDKWGWNINERGYINFPDHQGRIFKRKMVWGGKVHERIIGGQKFTTLPSDEMFCLQHYKTIEKQEKQNTFYNKL